ncbi:hypothetical protein [Piscinibacter gummiphilus]|uniref:Uncharacterized protein n=1 Tax=Piscinibacter gummiphilus TaxID=946333 RepID=A0ABZ0CNF4_9BURK|nr:hypothetical protein [Piscinibacter gummiphilus]WOB06520.1 hypothetical protein RXV79_16480 [Piscinibacter gummiphilus]
MTKATKQSTAGKPGRKAVDGATGVVRATVSLLPHHRDHDLPLLGGSAFLRKAIDDAMAELRRSGKVLKKSGAAETRSG